MQNTSYKLKILLVTRNFPPLTGGMERLVFKASQGLAEWAELTIIGPTGCGAFTPRGATVHEVPHGMAPFMLFATLAALKACHTRNFDLVLGGSGLTAPILALLQKFKGLRAGALIHGLDIVVNNAVYQRVFVPAVNRMDVIIANSRNTQRLALNRGAPAERITVINPGTDLPDLAKITPRDIFCKKYGIPFGKIMLFTGRITKRKGLSGFIANSLPLILKAIPDAGLIIVGDNPNQSLNKQGEKAEVLALIESMALKDKVIFLGQVNDDDLLAAYAASDIQVFPLIEVPGDVEGFGMVAIEAAACGTPTVAMNSGGVSDALSSSCGYLVSSNDFQAFANQTIEALSSAAIDARACVKHAESFQWTRFRDDLRQTLCTLPLIPRKTKQ